MHAERDGHTGAVQGVFRADRALLFDEGEQELKMLAPDKARAKEWYPMAPGNYWIVQNTIKLGSDDYHWMNSAGHGKGRAR